jgi:lactoylglutathione lyase
MKIEHIAIWTNNLEQLKSFYETYFNAQANTKYINHKTHFESYFLTFPQGGARLELMKKPEINDHLNKIDKPCVGLTHVAFSVGSKEAVDALTTLLEREGFTILSQPRKTGDGYYESCVLDPDGNSIEITI